MCIGRRRNGCRRSASHRSRTGLHAGATGFILLSDVLGLSALVNLMHDKTAIEPGTESRLLGPFYREDAPSLTLGDTIGAKLAATSSSSTGVSRIVMANRCRAPTASLADR